MILYEDDEFVLVFTSKELGKGFRRLYPGHYFRNSVGMWYGIDFRYAHVKRMRYKYQRDLLEELWNQSR